MQCVRERAGEIDVDAEDVDPAVLESFVITPRHFAGAMEKTAPSSLRDKAVEIPDCSWQDVGGLLDVKREMTETLMYAPRRGSNRSVILPLGHTSASPRGISL